MTKQTGKQIWDAALTLAHNLCAQVSDSYNNNDRTLEADVAGECCQRIKPFIGDYSPLKKDLDIDLEVIAIDLPVNITRADMAHAAWEIDSKIGPSWKWLTEHGERVYSDKGVAYTSNSIIKALRMAATDATAPPAGARTNDDSRQLWKSLEPSAIWDLPRNLMLEELSKKFHIERLATDAPATRFDQPAQIAGNANWEGAAPGDVAAVITGNLEWENGAVVFKPTNSGRYTVYTPLPPNPPQITVVTTAPAPTPELLKEFRLLIDYVVRECTVVHNLSEAEIDIIVGPARIALQNAEKS